MIKSKYFLCLWAEVISPYTKHLILAVFFFSMILKKTNINKNLDVVAVLKNLNLLCKCEHENIIKYFVCFNDQQFQIKIFEYCEVSVLK